MDTSKYLDSILKILPGVQARQIAETLRDLQASGQIRNAGEYEAKLRELATLVNSNTPVPSFKQIRSIIWNLCSSDAHNVMMQSMKNDIEAAFLQVNEMGQKIADHHILFMDNMLADLDRNLSEQENTIRRLEQLADTTNEFTQALVNTFSSSSLLSVSRSDIGADNLYFDNRTYKTKNSTELSSAFVSIDGSKLILDSESDPIVKPVEVILQTDSNSYGSEIHVDMYDDINNIIDGTVGTFWSRNVYLENSVSKVSTIIEFVFGAGRDINFVTIEGGSSESFFVERIDGITPDGNRINLLSEEIEIDRNDRIDFPRVLVKSIWITFSTKTAHRAEYFIPKDNSVHDVFDSVNKYKKLLKRDWLGPVSRDAINSEKIANACNIPQGTNNQINSFRYTLTLDNVLFGNSFYKDSGIFVSKPLKTDNIGILAIRAQESGIGLDTITNSIEYEIIKIDTSPIRKQVSFPIPYIGQTEVNSERLILFKKTSSSAAINDTGVLRFCPYVPFDWIDTDDSPIEIYKNGELLNIQSDFTIFINDDLSPVNTFSSMRDFSQYKMTPPKVWIKINRPDINAIYTSNYRIRTSDSLEPSESYSKTVWLDKEKTISLLDGGRVHFTQLNPDVIVSSEIYLQITLRRNLPGQSSSPELLEYAVLASSYS